MAFRTTPQLGPQLDEVFTGLPYWDLSGVTDGATIVSGITEASYRLGNKEIGSDGGEYFWVKASAAIAGTATTGTEVTITYPAYTVATGAGGFYTPPDTPVEDDGYVHVRRGAYNATPT